MLPHPPLTHERLERMHAAEEKPGRHPIRISGMARRDPILSSSLDLPGGAGPCLEPELAAALASSRPRLRKLALRFTRDLAAAEDVVQNACEKALRNRSRFRGDARPSTWLHRIVVNEALMWLRSEARRCRRRTQWAAASPGAVDPTPLPLEVLLERERHERLQRGLGTLRREDRDLLVHCALEGGSQVEWARTARLTPASAKTRAFRARRALRSVLEQDEAELPARCGPGTARKHSDS